MKKNLLKKAFLLLALIGGASNASADEAILSWYMGEDGTAATGANSITGASGCAAEGFTIAITGNADKKWSNGNGDITYNAVTYKTLKNSNGAQNTITCPDGCVATQVVFYATSNADSSGKLTEIDGTSCSDEVTSCKNYTSPTVISKAIDNKSSFTFTFSTKQVCFIAVVTYKSTVEAISEVLKSSSAVKVGESTLTKDAATNGYSIDGTTITLSNDISAVAAPTNVELVKTITFDDESTKDEDVDVTFDGTITDGYYIGTASIGLTGYETNYTVKVKKNVSPAAALSETSGTISMTNSYTVIGSTTVTLTGGNLTDGEYTVTADQAGTTISPSSFTVADGSVDQEFTITTSGSSAATTVFTFGTSDMGVAAPTYTLTYETVAKRSLSQADVSTATTWDWANAGSNSIQLTAETNPTRSEEFLLSDLQEIPNSGDFNSQALKVICEWPNRGNNSYIQVNSIKFNATVPGTVQVWFSNTGSRTDEPAQRRYLYVNNTNSDVYSLNTTMTNTAPMPVSAGEVVINAYTGTEVATMVRINKIVFTPVSSVSKTITEAGFATYCSPFALDFSKDEELKAYIITGNESGSKLALTQVTSVPANTGVLLEGPAAEYNIPVVANSSTDVSANKLVGVAENTVKAANSIYVLMNEGKVGFYKNSNEFTVGANTAYLPANFAGDSARSAYFFSDDITGIDQIDNGQLAIDNSQPVKRIVNGKLVIEKNGKKFNAAGALLY